MIVITEIKYIKTSNHRDTLELLHRQYPEVHPHSFEERGVETLKEMVKGRRFVNSRKETICIGLEKEVEELIGLPFEVFEKMRDEIETLENNIEYEKRLNKTLNDSLVNWEQMKLWGRIKNVFKRRR